MVLADVIAARGGFFLGLQIVLLLCLHMIVLLLWTQHLLSVYMSASSLLAMTPVRPTLTASF